MTILYSLAKVAAALTLLALGLRWHARAKKRRIVELLKERGELTGRELRAAGVGGLVYNYLYALEKDGIVERLVDGSPLSTLERGGRPPFVYRLKGPPS